MASLKVSYSSSSLSTPSFPFSQLLSFSKKVTLIGFPNAIVSPPKLKLQALGKTRATLHSAKKAAGIVKEVLPPALDSTSEPLPFFDGTTSYAFSYIEGYIYHTRARMRSVYGSPGIGLQGQIKLVPLDRQNRPDWYREKINPTNKVPSLEHKNEVKGESLDLIKYIDNHFEGPSLFPDDPAKKEFAEVLLSYADTFNEAVFSSFKVDGSEAGAVFDYIESALSKFEDGPFFLCQFSLVDIAYAPFIERFQPFLLDVKKYDITEDRPKLAAWIEEMDKNEAYKQTRREPKELVEIYKKRFLAQL